MVKWIASLAGLLAPSTAAPRDETPPAQPVRLIVGGPAAPELCMLPVEWNDLDAAAEMERVTRKRDVRVAQVKADGINAVYVDGAIVGGREGAPLDCALQCQPGLARMEAAIGAPTVFFGEYVADEGFSATLAEHKRGRGEGVFWLYDAVPLDAWRTGRAYDVAIEDRLARLRDVFRATEAGLFVGFLDFWLLDAGEMRAKAREVWAAGYEGLVSKRLGSAYERRRSPDWRKVKERFRAPCSVVDTIHRDGKLRSIIVRGPEPSSSKPLTLTGGWSEAEAASIDIGMAEGSEGRIVDVEFGLSTGATRVIRGAKFRGLLA